MQRPIRIVVLGLLCLAVGVLTGVVNLAQTAVSIMGPGGLEQMMAMMEGMGQPLTGSQREDFEVQISALSKPVFRVGLGAESLVSSVLAVVLIVAGVGLLCGRPWSLRLTRWWAFYTLPAAAISVVLNIRYVFPELPDVPAGGGVLYAVLMLMALWAFPVMLLVLLPTKQVKAYLTQRHSRPPTPQPMPNHPAPSIDTTAADDAPATRPGPSASPADTTWRDDPWNDANSR